MALRLVSGLSLIAIQASAMVLPIPGDTKGHGTSLDAIADSDGPIGLARTVLAPGSVIDCLTSRKSTEDFNGAAGAIDAFAEQASAANATVGVNECVDSDANGIRAKLCNRGDEPAAVPLKEAIPAFDAIRNHCQSTGSITSGDGWIFGLTRKNEQNRVRRASSDLQRRDCMERGSPAITACEADVCDPIYEIDENGDCQIPDDGYPLGTRDCYTYCEKTAYRFYGQGEADTDLDYCNGGDCSLSEGTSVLYTELFSVTLGFTGGISKTATGSIAAGVGWTWGTSKGTITTQTQQFGKGKCGYWWKIPVMINSCGTFTDRVEIEANYLGGPLDCYFEPVFRPESEEVCTQNVATVPGTDRDDIVVVPRYTTCDTREYLPDEEQSEEYKRIYVDSELAGSDGQGAFCVGADEDPDEFTGGIVNP